MDDCEVGLRMVKAKVVWKKFDNEFFGHFYCSNCMETVIPAFCICPNCHSELVYENDKHDKNKTNSLKEYKSVTIKSYSNVTYPRKNYKIDFHKIVGGK